jgi:A/G-specific adenine glycosylase
MMDLGATICTARNPACGICPLRSDCAAFLTADPAAFPVKAAKKSKPHRLGHGWWIERPDGHVWLVRRPAKGLLGGMRAFPSSDWNATPDATPPIAGRWIRLAEPVAHVFTHFSLALTVHVAHVAQDSMPPGEGEWWPLARIGEAGLPTLFRRAAEAAMKERKSDAH